RPFSLKAGLRTDYLRSCKMRPLLQHWVTEQAERRPDAAAFFINRGKVTYGQMEGSSHQLGALLQGSGSRKRGRVYFLIPKSPAAYISMLGILKADCVHVPMDTSSPAPRLARIVESCEPRFILGAGSVANLLDELMSEDRFRSSVSIGWMGADATAGRNFEVRFSIDDLDSYSGAPLDYKNTQEDPAHILFTSGSTGTPKGVVITHSNVIHFIEWANRYFGICSSDRLSAHPPLHFDLFTLDLFGALSSVAGLHLDE